MKLLFFTDTHIRGTSPKNRKDNIVETLETKFNEIVNIANNLNVDYVLHGGDLFDRPDVSPAIVRRFALILNKFRAPILAIAGNHDIYGHNPKTIYRTMLGIFDAMGLIRLIKENEKIIINKDVKLQLTGQPYRYDIDGNNKKGYIVTDKDRDIDYSIHMVHGMLLDRPFIKGIPYSLIDDLKDTLADITLSGHYHSGFGIKTLENKYFVNPGSLIRITNSIKEINRVPKVVLITLEKQIDIKLIPLKNILPGEEVLDREQLDLSIYRSEKLIQFKQSVDSAGDFEKLGINHILDNLLMAENVEEKVKKEAISRIEQAQIAYTGDDD
ncbi:metallophosphoesterase family protein [Clostridiisalibacter paucivorans]|uniref:metallophosphoesterase family protein n=1 Tax=Clostridiisalibacter paucivorans TaxID=408753 RepID=UPI00047BB743|nr:metallophosphoesterase [Clostridiisalibacter paucivorans]